MAVAAGLAEGGGLLFAAGLVTPLAALGIAIVMLNAIGLVHWPKGFFNTNGGIEFPLTLLTVAVAVSAIGPGRFSVDRAIGWDDNISGLWWGVGVAVAAVAVTLVTLTGARRRERLHAAPAPSEAVTHRQPPTPKTAQRDEIAQIVLGRARYRARRRDRVSPGAQTNIRLAEP